MQRRANRRVKKRLEVSQTKEGLNTVKVFNLEWNQKDSHLKRKQDSKM